ncbi:MAG: hypothetical protein R6U17_01485 [Thermoplasmata archaeon]
MGLSVSAAAGIVLIGFILVFGSMYPALERSQELKNEARIEWLEEQDARNNADMYISKVEHNESSRSLNIISKNIGSTVLRVSEIDVLLNGLYHSEKISASYVEGVNNTNLWNPGQELNLTLLDVTLERVERVILVDEFGSRSYYYIED